MKRFLTFFIVLIISMSICIFAESDIKLYLDGKSVNCTPAPMIINNRTMIPVRALFEEMGAKVSWEPEGQKVKIVYNEIIIEMTIGSDSATVNGAGAELDSPAVIVSDRTMIPLRFVGETIGAGVSWDEKTRSVKITSPVNENPPIIIEDVTFETHKGYDSFSMTASGKTTVKTMTLTNPSRLVLDIQNASLTDLNASFEGKAVSKARYGAHEGYVRFVAESDEIPGFIISDNGGLLQILLFSGKTNFNYIGMKDNILTFNEKIKITVNTAKDKEIVFTSDKMLIEESVFIGDELIDSISVTGNKITVKAKKKVTYEIKSNTIIFKEGKTENKEDSKEDVSADTGIVVLDAGHGGNDPGTLGYDKDGKTIIAKEKDMNLTLTLMVNEMLISQNVKTVLTRSEDVYVGLRDRADIANDCNAELFVSIHNNSIPDPEYKGSMVLYSLDSIEGKILAKNILKEMTSSAGTEDKGTRDGTNMSVIKNTKMPAVIVECGCLTNDEELENLMDIDFLYRLAEGIAEGILITLGR